VEMTTETMMQV